MSSMSFSTANWHWKNKNVTPWAKAWFERELPSVAVEGAASADGPARIVVERVTEVEGDVELGRRKSKLITIFDCRVVLVWQATAADGTEASGKLVIPEVSHDIVIDGISEYVWEFSLTSESSPTASALLALAKKQLPAALEAVFNRFPAELIDTHGKDIIVGDDPSRGGSPAPPATAPTAAAGAPSTGSAPAATPAKPTKPKSNVNTAVVEVEATFQASAADLYSILTDEKRIPTWSRAPAKSVLKEEGEYELFGGGVRGKYVALSPGKEVKQTWALQSPTWPSGHEATHTITFNQSTDSTKVTFSLSGVPTGLEDELRRNIEGYYVHGLKSIGYVYLVPTPLPGPRPTRVAGRVAPTLARRQAASSASWGAYVTSCALATLVVGAALAVPLFYRPGGLKPS